MQPLQIVPTPNAERNTALASQRLVDEARASALEDVLNGKSLEHGISKIVSGLERVLGSCCCQVLLFKSSQRLFKPTVNIDTKHQAFLSRLLELLINNPASELNQTVLSKADAIYQDIYQNKLWAPLHIDGKEQGIIACWAMPILSATEELVGVLVALFNTPRANDKGELQLCRSATSSLSALVSHFKHKASELHKNVTLQQHLSDKNSALQEANTLIGKALTQRNEVQTQLLELENMASLGAMLSSLTHEINTPIGVSLTAASFMAEMQSSCAEKLQVDKLKRSELLNYIKESAEASQIIERNMLRADELVKTFKQLSLDQHSHVVRRFKVCDYIFEVLLTLKPRLKKTPHRFCVDIPCELEIQSNPGALSQLLINLIMNSANHAFDENVIGHITISAGIKRQPFGDKKLELIYQDNGRGMAADTMENLYKPFFTLAKEKGGSGLGMHICNNIVMKVLRGTIDCASELGKGVKFTIQFPV